MRFDVFGRIVVEITPQLHSSDCGSKFFGTVYKLRFPSSSPRARVSEHLSDWL